VGLLTLVRHGQASLFSDNYDQLSELGRSQARLLGEYWLRIGVAFDEAITGPRQRQLDTGRIVAEVYAAAGTPFPELRVVPDFDEMHAEELLRKKLPLLVTEHESLRALVANLSATENRSQALRGFQRVFEAVMGMWIRGEIDAPEIESWQAFCARVASGLGNLREGDQKGRRVVAFTSAGTVAAAMRTALELSDMKMLDLASVIRNASVTELAFTRTRLTPMTFNAIPHLPDPTTVTSR
jgi:broad specificity phosphatase PhoE